MLNKKGYVHTPILIAQMVQNSVTTSLCPHRKEAVHLSNTTLEFRQKQPNCVFNPQMWQLCDISTNCSVTCPYLTKPCQWQPCYIRYKFSLLS